MQIDSPDDVTALQLVDEIRKRRTSEILERKQRIAALKSQVEDEKEIEDIKEDIALNIATPNSIPQPIVPTAVLHNSSAIRQARFLLDSVFDPSINSGGKYKLLSDLGIGLAPA